MRRSPGNPIEEFEELRQLLLSREREQLRELHDRITDKERRSQDIASVLPEAVKISRGRGEELTHALRPAVEGSIKESIDQRPQIFVDALHPIIGPIVRRSIAESLRRLLQSLNQTLEHTFSWRGLKWRFEALRTGRSFAEVVMLRSLVYRVEQLFLIHRETSLALLHVNADPSMSRDSDMVAGMLSAIQDFGRDSFEAGEESVLEEFRVGELQVWIAPGRSAYLAAVIRGNPPRELRSTLEETIESIHVLKGRPSRSFKGTRPSSSRSGRNWRHVCALNTRARKATVGQLARGSSSSSQWQPQLPGSSSLRRADRSGKAFSDDSMPNRA